MMEGMQSYHFDLRFDLNDINRWASRHPRASDIEVEALGPVIKEKGYLN